MTETACPFNAVDFDHHSQEFASNTWVILRELRAQAPVAWSEHHGGFWVVTSYDEVMTALRDWQTFSSLHEEPYATAKFGGQAIPPYPIQESMTEMDPPLSREYRMLIQHMFVPSRVEDLKPRVRQITRDCLQARLTEGSIDIIMDLVNQVPSKVVLEFLGLPVDDWPRHALPMHEVMHCIPGSPEHQAALEGFNGQRELISTYVDSRQQNPSGDVLSQVVNGSIGGKRIGRKEAIDLAWVLISAALETVTGVMAYALRYLDQDRAARQLLIDHPELMPVACEEFFRYFSPSRGIARTVTVDTVLGGQRLRAGDRVLLMLAGANHDEQVFEAAETIDITRAPNKHLTFGQGVHVCVGAAVARAELQIVLEEVLKTIPDYTIDPSSVEEYRFMPVTTGFATMSATFAPR